MATIYDPPNGWRYGFPKQYLPQQGESLAQTLLRDGYPQQEIDAGMDNHVRFWEVSDAKFARNKAEWELL